MVLLHAKSCSDLLWGCTFVSCFLECHLGVTYANPYKCSTQKVLLSLVTNLVIRINIPTY